MPQVLLHCYQHQTWFLLLGTVFKIWKFPTWPVSLIPKSFVAQINWTMTREQHACHGIRWARFETVGWRWHRPSGAIHKSWSVQFATDVRPLAKGTLRGGFTTKMRDEGEKKQSVLFYLQLSLRPVAAMQWIQHYRIYIHPKLILWQQVLWSSPLYAQLRFALLLSK